MSTLSRTSQAKLHDIAERYVAGGKNREVPGLIYVAFREGGQPIFEHYAGCRGIEPGTPPMDADTICWLASFTKLVTSVACMQLVEHGVLELDNPDQIATLAPELRDIKVLERAEDGIFYLVEKRGEITLRMLLNHTAGFGYAFEDEKLAHYGQPVGLDDFCGELSDLLRRPLVNHPGETFQYGTSMDWVGILIERVTGFTLEEVFQKYIFSPLGMVGVTFYPTDETRARLAYLHRRGPDGNLAQRDHLYAKPLRVKEGSQRDEIFCAGGHGLFGPPAEFRKLIGMLLNDGLDLASGARLLNKATVDEMFKDQIPSMPRYSNESVPVAKPHLANPTPLVPMPADHTEGWGLGFSISHLPSETGRPAGVGSWEGLANLFWFADRENKVGAIIASQILPYGDLHLLKCADEMETVLYREILEAGTS
ncbi:beta-lactamase family protein [Plectosphaerella cucumerina]|uniref:Beta-lactamase family protein n=1 Tax=Plectosphaerella cucumerina TaxID=40658 RepID=A0A8K0TUV2_9PEZI|nr:beta-lactamase family protein [Plectosphaerella cucumerina]